METGQEAVKEVALVGAGVHPAEKMVKQIMGVGVEVKVLQHLQLEEGQRNGRKEIIRIP